MPCSLSALVRIVAVAMVLGLDLAVVLWLVTRTSTATVGVS